MKKKRTQYLRPINFFHPLVVVNTVRSVPQVIAFLINEMGRIFVTKVSLQGMLCISVNATNKSENLNIFGSSGT